MVFLKKLSKKLILEKKSADVKKSCKITPWAKSFSLLTKNHAGPVEKLIIDFFQNAKKVGTIDSL